MEPNKPTTQERYIATSAYLFEIGYMISWLTQTESEFTKFHFEQMSKIITRIILPGIAILFAGILWDNALSKFLIYVGGLFIIASFILSIVGAWHALNGRMKKLL